MTVQVKFNPKKLVDTMNNIVNYSDGFIKELKNSESKLNKKVANTSINAFYDYLDGLARSHPGMLHHVYEWGQVGDPFGRLYELKMSVGGRSVSVDAEFLYSDTPSNDGSEPFYDKAFIMEEGIPVTVTEKDASALFFEIDGEEFFRHGPITIANPGGSATRGSFVKAFNEFYKDYFQNVYLSSIRFYNHFRNPKEYEKNIRIAAKNKAAYTLGKKVALSWIEKAPGDKL